MLPIRLPLAKTYKKTYNQALVQVVARYASGPWYDSNGICPLVYKAVRKNGGTSRSHKVMKNNTSKPCMHLQDVNFKT